MYKLAFLLFLPFFSNGQVISTFAGCGTMCTGVGDGGPATVAVVNDPIGGTFDKYGNYYFAEGLGKRVRKIDTAHIITTIAGTGSSSVLGDGGQATAAGLPSPNAVKLDTFGNLYLLDGNNRVRKVVAVTGIISTIVGDGTGALLGDGGPATAAELYGPSDICFDKKGNLYIADGFNYRIRKVNAMGIISTFAGNGFAALGSGDGGPATAAKFSLPTGIIADDIGNIYIADESANTVRKVDTFGNIITVAGNTLPLYTGDGIPATNAQISPIKVAIDSSGNLIIGDRYNERVFRVDHAGIIHSIAGIGGSGSYSGDGGPATAASFDVGGVSFDPCWNLYISDINNRRIRKVTNNPTCNPHSHIHFDSSSLMANTLTSRDINIYPNPANTSITIQATYKISQITITSLLGQIFYTQKYNMGEVEVNIAGLPEGVYIVKVTDNEGKVTVNKILKE